MGGMSGIPNFLIEMLWSLMVLLALYEHVLNVYGQFKGCGQSGSKYATSLLRFISCFNKCYGALRRRVDSC